MRALPSARTAGSITVFLAMILTIFFSAVFAFLEISRVSALKANSEVSTMQARDTVLASYHGELWENYHLMFWEIPDGDLDELGSLQQAAIEGNRSSVRLSSDNYYVLPVRLAETETTAYQLVTDSGGAAFKSQAAEMMKLTMAEDAVDNLLSWLTGDDVEESETDLESEALDALESLETAVAEAAEAAESGEGNGEVIDTADIDTSGIEIKENPLQWVKKVATNGVLSFVTSPESISSKAIDTGDCIENRSLESGNTVVDAESGMSENAWFYLYLDKYFTDFTESSGDHALDYELEYMIAGKDSDQANLKAVVRRLLLTREAANMLFLETDTAKREEASAVALLLSSAVGLPVLQPVVLQGVLAAWAYAESISDVRILMEGGKVKLVKTEEQWHTDITSLAASVMSTDGQQQSEGLSYSDYLQVLMRTVSNEKLAVRAMDMIEKNLDVRMDRMLCYAECSYIYESEPLFWNFVTIGSNSPGAFRFGDEATISFLQLSG